MRELNTFDDKTIEMLAAIVTELRYTSLPDPSTRILARVLCFLLDIQLKDYLMECKPNIRDLDDWMAAELKRRNKPKDKEVSAPVKPIDMIIHLQSIRVKVHPSVEDMSEMDILSLAAEEIKGREIIAEDYDFEGV